ncbi:hypothetical protein [Psychrobacter sp. P11G5]|uniref:hypothetical protein n=1 Tax=Psychrobacter sp. P11G5 TaxID=1699624 RepID=UPI00078D1D4C|nr:hypothetical protein [Psychrobacter sp. P11G5]AMN69039.1 hypothetical protein AK825_14335 [Psychrobacter sp. P11G5]
MTSQKNLWILTEERPKTSILQTIIGRFCNDYNIGFFANPLRIIPLINNEKFTFTYQVLGINSPNIGNIYIKIVSGYSSFVDFLVYFQKDQPIPTDIPLYAIEETKTDDSESRNTGVYQRCTKFVYIDYFYSHVKKIMLYDLQITQKASPTKTNIFGSRLLATCGVEVLGKVQTAEQEQAFNSIDELIQCKKDIKAHTRNVPIDITKHAEHIEVSGRLRKGKTNTLSYDPNIGALTIIAKALRVLGWDKDIIITKHELAQEVLTNRNKFIYIANRLDIKLQGLEIPQNVEHRDYWRYEEKGEKLATIFIHLVVESFTKGYSIFENHAGCGKSYFKKSNGDVRPLVKYSYENNGKRKIAHIPDLILVDMERLEVINIEGKTYANRSNGINELLNYDFIDSEYIKQEYPDYSIKRTVVVYGSDEEEIMETKISFMLNKKGKMVLGIQAPQLFHQAISNLLHYWKRTPYLH